ncbi:MAG: STAS domain-containing protein [Anaerolineales bacterium]|jgi:anti-anti-sigma factor
MARKPCEAEVRQQDGKVVIDLSGEIDAFAEKSLNEAYQDAISGDPSTVVLNFSDVDYINSTGIALIVSLLAQARKAHRELVVYGLNDHYVEIFQITRLSDFMTIYPDEESALVTK